MRTSGPWSQEEISRFLADARVPLRLACNGASGHPLLASLWFVPIGGRLWCATQRSSRVVARIRRDPRCAFEVSPDAPPYRGVRGRAKAALHDDRGAAVLNALITRYLDDTHAEFAAWLRSRAATETAIAIEPLRLVSWDFEERMGAAA